MNLSFAFLESVSKCEIVTNRDRKSTRLNSSHDQISYAVFCLKKKKKCRLGRYLKTNTGTLDYGSENGRNAAESVAESITRASLSLVCGRDVVAVCPVAGATG